MNRRLFLIFIFALGLLAGCGGGTSGTDGGSTVTIIGRLINQDGTPISNATVTATGNELPTLTSEDGVFYLETSSATELSLSISRLGEVFSTTVSDLPDTPSEISVTIELQPGIGISVVSLAVRPLDQEVPLPTPTAEVNPSPQPTPKNNQLSVVHGILVDKASKPVTDATISVVGGTSTTNTDAAGSFSFNTAIGNRELQLLIKTGKLSATVTVRGLPAKPSVITLVLRLTLIDSATGGDPTVVVSVLEQSAR